MVLTLRLTVLCGHFTLLTVWLYVAEMGSVNCTIRTGSLYKTDTILLEMVKVPNTHARFRTSFLPPTPIVIILVSFMFQIAQNPFLPTELLLECLNPEEEGNAVIRNVRKYSRCSYSFTSSKTEYLNYITLRNEQHKVRLCSKKEKLLFC